MLLKDLLKVPLSIYKQQIGLSSIPQTFSHLLKQQHQYQKEKQAIIYDFRSDTVTKPFPIKQTLPYLDDVMDQDPYISQLESLFSEWSGFPKALFCPSGTMSNQIAIYLHSHSNQRQKYGRGSIWLDQRSHLHLYENHGISSLSGAGTVFGKIEDYLTSEADVHYPQLSVVCLENTMHGCIYPQVDIEALNALLEPFGIPLHLDGARILHVAAEQEQQTSGLFSPVLNLLLKPFKTVSICLSKAIGAPVGSILLMPEEWYLHVRRIRKLFGGGLRQSGLLAQHALDALDRNYFNQKLSNDTTSSTIDGEPLRQSHILARQLSKRLADFNIPTLNPVDTNMLFIQLPRSVTEFVSRVHQESLKDIEVGKSEVGVLLSPWGYPYTMNSDNSSFENRDLQMRLVLHPQIEQAGVDKLVELFERVV